MIRQLLALVFLILSLILVTLMSGCNTSQQESESGEITLDSAIALAKHVEYTIAGDSCIILYHRAMQLAKKQENFGRQIYLHDKLAESYMYFDNYLTGKLHLDSAFEIAKVHDTYYEWIGMCYSTLGGYYTDLGDFEKGLFYLEKTLKYRLEKLGKNHEDISNSYFVLGYYYSATRREFDKAIEYNEKALDLRIKTYGKESAEAGECYLNLANSYSAIGEHEKAVKLQKKSTEIFEKTLPDGSRGLLNGYRLLGLYNSYFGNTEEAIRCYQKVLNTKKNNENELVIIQTLNNLGDAFLKSDTVKAKSIYDSCLNIISSNWGKNHVMTLYTRTMLSNYYEYLEVYDSAEYHLNLASNISALELGKNSNSYATLAMNYADLLLKMNKAAEAVEKANDAIDAIFSIHNNSSNKNITFNSDNKIYRLDLTWAYSLKAKALSQIDDTQSLKSSFSYHLKSMEIIEYMKSKFSWNYPDNFYNKRLQETFDNSIQIALEIARRTNDNYYQKYAFTLADKSRSFNLLKELANTKAKQFSGIPKEILDEEDQFKRDITFYNELIYKLLKNKGYDSMQLRKFKLNLLEKERGYDLLVRKLEKNFPKYFQLKHQLVETTVDNIQKLLNEDEAIIEYYLGESKLVTFVLTKDTYKVSNIEIDHSFIEMIESYNESLVKRNHSGFLKTSKKLYQSLIEPIESNLPKTVKKLRIIPHNELASISFDCLIAENTGDLISSKTHFLIEDYEIRYHYSASYLKAKYDEAKTYNKATVFAPIFEKNEKLNRLKWSEREANKISSQLISHQFVTDLYLREEATKTKFLNNSSGKDIIHLATHSFLNQENIEQSKIYFSENEANDNSLTLAETYNLNISPKLLTLSSCETGIGKVVKGEGMLSFTRGFSYSGAKNIVCSMWKVDDLYTSELMISMYDHLLSGNSIAAALRSSKLKLLKEQSGIHPKEWAGFILIEN